MLEKFITPVNTDTPLSERTAQNQLRIILSVVFFGFVGLAMPYLIFPALFLNSSSAFLPSDCSALYRGVVLGVTLGAFPLGQFFGSPVLGALSDELGRRRILALSLFIAGLCNLVTALALHWESLWLLIVMRFFTGCMEGNLAIARAMASDLKELDKRHAFGKITTATSVAYLFGPIMGAWISDPSIFPIFSLSMPFYLTFILSIPLSLLTYFRMIDRSDSASTKRSRTIVQRLNLIHRLGNFLQYRRLIHVMLALTIFTLAVDIFYSFGPSYLVLKWQLGSKELAWFNASLCLGMTLTGSVLISRLSKSFSHAAIVSVTIPSFALGLLIMPMIDSQLLMFILFFALGIVMSLTTILTTVEISNEAPEKSQGEIMGIQISLRVLADAFICMIGGASLALSAEAILIVAAAIGILSLGYYLVNVPSSIASTEY